MPITREGYEAQERLKSNLEIQKLRNALFIWKCYAWMFFAGFAFTVFMIQYTKTHVLPFCN